MRSIFNKIGFVYNNTGVIYNFNEKAIPAPSVSIDGSYRPTKPITRRKNNNLTFRKKIWQLYQ